MLPRRKMFHLSLSILADTFFHVHMAILSDFHRQSPGYLKGGLLCKHDMAREIGFHFLLEEEWNF